MRRSSSQSVDGSDHGVELVSASVLAELERLVRPHLAEAADLFRVKRRNARTARGVWLELVYCILAGSQVPVEAAQRSHAVLKAAWHEGMRRNRFALVTEPTQIERLLKTSGYRYYRTKAEVIARAADFVQSKYRSDLRLMIRTKSVREIETELRSNVKGIGRKIANHWLRNVGLDTCTVDIHLKRLFNDLSVIECDPERETKAADFDRVITCIRELAARINVPLGETQYALWLAARNKFGGGHLRRKDIHTDPNEKEWRLFD